MNIKTWLLTGAVALTASPLAAHHNFAAHYRGSEIVENRGVVTEFRFVNPHARVYFDVTNPDGTTEEWMAEGDASVALRRSGWEPDQLKPGDRIHVVGNPSLNGTNTMSWDSITLDGGIEFGGGDGRDAERMAILNRRLTEHRTLRAR
jgi:hypothetical protein